MPFDNVVVGRLPVTAGLRHVAVQDAVQLQDGALRERNLLSAFVDQSQRIPVTRHLLFRTAFGGGVLEHKGLEATGRHDYSFEAVGRPRRFNDRDLP